MTGDATLKPNGRVPLFFHAASIASKCPLRRTKALGTEEDVVPDGLQEINVHSASQLRGKYGVQDR
jgi:hypothetical protein